MIATALDINNIDSISAAMHPNVSSQITGPDSNGEFASPLEGALWMAGTYQIPQIPLNGKAPFFPEWPTKASTDPTQIRAWWDQYHGNFGSLAVPGKHFVFETDSPAVRERFRAQRHDFTAKLIIESRQGEHRYYLSAPGIENIAQHAVKHADFSIRADGEQCVSPGSLHPTTGKQYKVVFSAPLSAPTPEEVALWKSEKKSKSAESSASQAMIPDGRRNSTLMSIAGSYLDLGESPDQVKERIEEINSERCSSPLSEDELSKTIFASIDRYAKNPDSITRMAKEIIPFVGSSRNSDEAKGRTMQFVRGDSIQPKRVRWLWRGRILADKLNVFSGEPDVGKGMTTVDLAARLTNHLDFPDGKNELGGPKDVVFLSSEDDMEDTIVPRLIVAGADMKRIHFVQISENSTGTLEEGIVCLDRDLPCLEEIVKLHPDIVLIIPDPVIAFLGDADPNKDKDVRPIYSKMKAFGKRLNVGWLFVNHWNKNQTASSINRTSGAKTMVSAPRATWMFTRSPEDPTRYLMMKGKGNLAGNAKKTLAYRIIGVPYDFQDGQAIDPDGVPKLVWDGETEHSTEDVLKDQNDPRMRHNIKAEELLSALLKDGAMRAKDVYQAGDKENLKRKQRQRAREKARSHQAMVDHLEKLKGDRMNAQHIARRIQRGQCMLGEVSPGVDARTVEEALEVAREMGRALNVQDVKDGESLLDFERRIFDSWVNYADFVGHNEAGGNFSFAGGGHAPYLNRETGELSPGPGRDYWVEHCGGFEECWKSIPGSRKATDLATLPKVKKIRKPEESKPEPKPTPALAQSPPISQQQPNSINFAWIPPNAQRYLHGG